MHKPWNQQKGGTKFSELLDSLELEQETESDTLLLIQKKRYSLPYNYLWAAVNEWQNEHLDMVLLTVLLWEVFQPCQERLLSVRASCLSPLRLCIPPGRQKHFIVQDHVCKTAVSKAGQWNWGFPWFLFCITWRSGGCVAAAWAALHNLCGRGRQLLMLSAFPPSLGVLQPWLLFVPWKGQSIMLNPVCSLACSVKITRNKCWTAS